MLAYGCESVLDWSPVLHFVNAPADNRTYDSLVGQFWSEFHWFNVKCTYSCLLHFINYNSLSQNQVGFSQYSSLDQYSWVNGSGYSFGILVRLFWKTYFTDVCNLLSYNIWYFPAPLFSGPPKCDVITIWGDCFLVRSVISLAVITSEVGEVTSAYCTGCWKPSVRFHVMQWPSGAHGTF